MPGRRTSGFTIVELLIVVVVIAILAAVTLVAYSGIRERSQQSAQASTLSQAMRKVKLYAVDNSDQYPATLAAIGLANNGSTTYRYEVDNSVTPKYYCVSVKVSNRPEQFISTQNETPAAGSCLGMVGWWPLNNDLSDYARYKYSGYTSSTAPTATTGQNGASGGYQFSGSTYYKVPGFDHGILRQSGASGAWSLSVWAKANSATQVSESVLLGRAGCHGGLYTYTSASVNYYYFSIKSSDASNCWTGAVGLSGLTIDTGWHLLTATYNAAAMRLYVDGTLVQSGTMATSMQGYGTELTLGGNTGRIFDGIMDDARAYTRELSATEIADMYAGGAY